MKTTIFGYIGKDAQLRKVGAPEAQYSVCSIWVAENVNKRDGTKKTLWHKVTLWRKYAEAMAPHLKSGRKVYVTGNAEAAFYTKDNQVIPYINIQAEEVRLLDAPPAEEAVPEEEEEAEEGTPWDD